MEKCYTPTDFQQITPFLSVSELPDTIQSIHYSINIILCNSDELNKKDLQSVARIHSLGMVLYEILSRKMAA
jgi:hypothetical protein